MLCLLPEELIVQILSFLNPRWIGRLALTSSHMYRLIFSQQQQQHYTSLSDHIWKTVYEQRKSCDKQIMRKVISDMRYLPHHIEPDEPTLSVMKLSNDTEEQCQSTMITHHRCSWIDLCKNLFSFQFSPKVSPMINIYDHLMITNHNRTIKSDSQAFWKMVYFQRPITRYTLDQLIDSVCWEVVLDEFESHRNYFSVVIGVSTNPIGERSEVVSILGNSSGEIGFSTGNLGLFENGTFVLSKFSNGELAFPSEENGLRAGDAIGVKLEPIWPTTDKKSTLRWEITFYVNGKPVEERTNDSMDVASRIISSNFVWPAISLISSQKVSIRHVQQLPY